VKAVVQAREGLSNHAASTIKFSYAQEVTFAKSQPSPTMIGTTGP